MALTYPLAMPPSFPAQQKFFINRVDYVTPETGGLVSGVTAGFPLWRAEWTIAEALGRLKAEAVEAWVDSLDGQQKTFYGADYSRPYPLAYAKSGFTGLTRAAGGTFDGSAATWSVDSSRTVLTLTGLPAGFVLNLKDYIGFRWTTSSQARRALVRCVEAAVANGSGQLSVTVRPALPTLVPGAAVAYLDNAHCIMRLLTGETDVGSMTRRLSPGGRITAVQDLRA